ncbi:hypothetical protein D5S17_26845 [Pseudonocardiaceae bacterium YIM PH 21723]|nr:hypothetical protein D5S17_26845 [Pseudonocardiaceae bacterium YIM PH 21723]
MEPGGYRPLNTFGPLTSLFCATASSSPLPVRIAISIASPGTPSTAACAAACILPSMVSRAGLLSPPPADSSATSAPAPSTAITRGRPDTAWPATSASEPLPASGAPSRSCRPVSPLGGASFSCCPSASLGWMIAGVQRTTPCLLTSTVES